MNIIILILIALGFLRSNTEYTDEYQRTHQAEINKATTIYNNGDYTEVDGGVIIDNDGNP